MEGLIGLLADPYLAVRAARILGTTNDRRAVRPLIDELARKGNLIREQVAQALRRLTGQDFGEDRDRWEAWREQACMPTR